MTDAVPAGDPLASFSGSLPFELDGFQRRAIEALQRGDSVLVAAPTGSGKTAVAEFACWLALGRGAKCFYTTPLKALSNQKFGDLVARHGARDVGLLTGDNTINGEAQLVVMTTEVLRNMLYEQTDTLRGLRWVVLDEVHYLQDPYRGAVWEEVLIHLPPEVAVVCLSATVSNAAEFGDWLPTLRGPTEIVVERTRPVELRNLTMVGEELYPLFAGEGAVNPDLVRAWARGTHAAARYGTHVGPRNPPPEKEPDHTVVYRTLPQQALIYRLSGDRNPLHSDPAFAQAGGFDAPILHGLCTYGHTGRALLHTFCGSDPARFRSIEGRFSKPVWRGDELTIRMWQTGDGEAAFQTERQTGDVVIDQGRLTFMA